MARSSDTVVDPAILVWARSTAGLSIEEAAARIPTKAERVLDWERGESGPSMAQLRKMAGIYKRLLSDFFLAAVPQEEALPHDFRRMPGEVAGRYSRALRVQLRMAGERRQLALDLVADLDTDLPKLAGRLQFGSNPETVGGELRHLLGVTMPEQRTWRNPRDSYNNWRAAAERTGILVFQAAGIAPAEMLGFALPARPLPVIGVNRKLRPNGRTFTLLHECVHVFLEQSSICDIDEGMLRPPEDQRVEVFCNAVAGAALVPFEFLLSEPLVRFHPPRPRDWSGEELGALGRTFGVSEEVILRRLLTAGRTSNGFYAARRQAWGALINDVAEADPEAEFRRNMPQEVVSDLGRPFTRLVVDSYVSSFTSLSDVSRYLGLRAGQVPRVQELLAGR